MTPGKPARRSRESPYVPSWITQGMSEEAKARYGRLLAEDGYAPKSKIFGPGDPGDRMYTIVSGHVRLYQLHEDGKEITLAILGPGDVFGEMALFGEVRQTRFAQTLDDAVVCSAPTAEFLKIMHDVPEVVSRIAAMLSRRVLQGEMQIENLAYTGVRGRLVAVLLSLAVRFGEPVEGGTEIALRLSHQDLANYAGTTRESCSVELRRLVCEGIIRFTGDRHIIVKNLDRLKPTLLDRHRAALKLTQ